jgi:hypothetical protein
MTAPPPDESPPPEPEDICEVCGSTDVVWRQCKLLCRNCGTIVKSCADLAME